MRSRCAPAATAPQRQRQHLRQRISQTWTSVIRRRGRSAASGGPQRNPQTLLSFPATALLLAPALRHKQQDNKLLRVTFITHQPLALHDCEEGPTLHEESYRPFALHTQFFITVSVLLCYEFRCRRKLFQPVKNVNIRSGHQITFYLILIYLLHKGDILGSATIHLFLCST